jgi:predicted TPR repeat methyltransferase
VSYFFTGIKSWEHILAAGTGALVLDLVSIVMDPRQKIFAQFARHQQCVEELFDEYADDYDQCLVQGLNYQEPSFLHDKVKDRTFKRCLDLGCGTGLSGIPFRSNCNYLEGIDLSAGMLEKARGLSIYDRLEHGDIVRHLQSQPDSSFDLLISAGVFIYIFDVEVMFVEAKRVCEKGGRFVFSTEWLSDKEEPGVVERDSERFAHSRKFILSKADGFELENVESLPGRTDGGDVIQTDIWVLKRK